MEGISGYRMGNSGKEVKRVECDILGYPCEKEYMGYGAILDQIASHQSSVAHDIFLTTVLQPGDVVGCNPSPKQ